ncbi:MAG: hypothetical protein C5B47_07965 [Verrucomicrobia bacterium]|nr:MAG: hypothetical protein C5B47_07965 [Verrucomicrobiota bacterium]
MTTKQLSNLTGVPEFTIRRLAPELDGVPCGGRYGYVFPKDAPKRLLAILRQRRGGSQWRIFQMRKNAKEQTGA